MTLKFFVLEKNSPLGLKFPAAQYTVLVENKETKKFVQFNFYDRVDQWNYYTIIRMSFISKLKVDTLYKLIFVPDSYGSMNN